MNECKASKVALFLANGCEEIEALTVVDILRRARIECTTVSINKDVHVISTHQIPITADTTVDQLQFEDYDMIVLPGGIPGTPNLEACDILMQNVKAFAASGKFVGAICAAPSILAHAGLLNGRNATCNPCVNDELIGSGANLITTESVVRDGNIITSRAFGTAIPFGLELLTALTDKDTAQAMSANILYTPAQ